jgi:hypothetical protein
MVIALSVATITTEGRRTWAGSRVVFAGAALAASALVALHTNVNRYTQGLDDISLDPGARAEWWWSLAPSPAAVVVIGGIAFAGMFVALGVFLHKPRVAKTERSIAEDGEPTFVVPAAERAADGASASVSAPPMPRD